MARTPAAEARRKAQQVTSAGPTRFYLAFCPTCGLARSAHYVGADGEAKIGWNLSEDQHGHFGALFESAGRATIRLIKFTEPRDDDEGLYERVRRQLLDGLTVWLRNGWLDENDVLGTIQASKGPIVLRPPLPALAAAAAPTPARPTPTRRRQRVLAGRAFTVGDRVQAGGIVGTVVDVSDPALLIVRTDAGGEAQIGRGAAQPVGPEPTRAPPPTGKAAPVSVPLLILPRRPTPEVVQELIRHLHTLEEVGVSKRAVQDELKRVASQVGAWTDAVQAAILREEETAKPNREVLAGLRPLATSLVATIRNLQARKVTSSALAAAVEALTQAYPPQSAVAPVPPPPAAPPTPPKGKGGTKSAPPGALTGKAAVEAAHSRMSNWKTPNSTNAEKVLDDLEMRLGLDVSAARDTLENYRGVTREEYPEAEEYGEARDEAWGEFLAAVEAIESEEEEPEEPAQVPKALQKLQGVQDARLKGKAPPAAPIPPIPPSSPSSHPP